MPTIPDWVDLILRWFHVMAGISWVGGSLYLLWLARILDDPDRARRGESGEPWLVDLGGALLVEKLGLGADGQARTHHWFKRESTLTWLSGFILLVAGPMAGLAIGNDPGAAWRMALLAGAATLALFAASWVGYDRLWSSRLGARPALAGGLSFAVLCGIAWVLAMAVPGRVLHIVIGALLGSLMALNVWHRVLPGLDEMNAARREQRRPDEHRCALARTRSIHNSYLMFPVVVLMLGNHFPAWYGHSLNWLVTTLVVAAFVFARHVVATGGAGKWALLPALGLFAAAALVVDRGVGREGSTEVDAVPFSAARTIIFQQCQSCHSSVPTDRRHAAPAGGIAFDDPASIAAMGVRIRAVTTGSRTMPPPGAKAMTEDERQLLGRWVAQGAKLE